MTVRAERASSQMPVDLFERIAEFAAREDETVRFELIDGRIGLKKVTNGNRGEIVIWLIRQCMRSRPELNLNPTQGLQVEACRKGQALPGAVLTPVGPLHGSGRLGGSRRRTDGGRGHVVRLGHAQS